MSSITGQLTIQVVFEIPPSKSKMVRTIKFREKPPVDSFVYLNVLENKVDALCAEFMSNANMDKSEFENNVKKIQEIIESNLTSLNKEIFEEMPELFI